MKKVLVTGHLGYIGVHLVDVLKKAGHEVVGCDIGLFVGTEWETFTRPDIEWEKDVRDITEGDLLGIDCVMHLAALSNDPMGDVDADLTFAINRDASIRLADIAKKAGVSRFLFASSCSIYGKGDKLDIDETGKTAPLTAYAKSKIDTENHLLEIADDNFCTVSLRNSTAYGHSPSLRIDLVVNNLLACAIARGDIRVMSDGSPWRPLIHCKDIARAFAAFLEAPSEKVSGLVVNIGANEENYQVRDVLSYVEKLRPQAKVVYTGEVGADPRNYRVSFNLLNKILPDFKLSYSVESGMEELNQKYIEHNFQEKDFDSDQFIRLKVLKKNLYKIAGV